MEGKEGGRGITTAAANSTSTPITKTFMIGKKILRKKCPIHNYLQLELTCSLSLSLVSLA